MSDNPSHLYHFGKCLLDSEKKVLWSDDKPVPLPLKAVELLSVLVTKGGAVVTKDEIWRSVWQDSFVEETNLTHNIYLLRKTFKDLGEPDLIQTVPRRGYRFAGEVRPHSNGDLVIEKHSFTRTLVEELPANEVALDAAKALRTRSIVRSAAVVVVVIATLGLAIAVWRGSPADAVASSRMNAIAVLPLTSINKNDDDSALGLGIADALITRLGKLNVIRIVSTKTASRYSDTTREPVDIGRELGVDGVLDGTLQRANGRLRVTLRLIRTSDGVQIWSGLISDTESEIFRLEDALAHQTAQALSLNLKPVDDPKRPTSNLEAYHQFLRGDYLFRLRGHKNATLSVPFFKEAVRLDPDFAQAWAGLAAALAMGIQIPEAEAMLERALQRDPGLAEAHATRGFIQMFHYWNWPEAEASLNRAIELDPNSLQAHHWRGVYLSFHGRLDEARAEMERALELDPVSVNLNSDLGQLYYFAGDNARGEEYCKRALSMDPEYGFAHGYLSYIYESQGKPDEAFGHFARGECWNSAEEASCIDEKRRLYEQGGWRAARTENSKKVLSQMDSGKLKGGSRSSVYYALAMDAARVGDDGLAIEYLNRAVDSKARFETMNFTFPYLRVHPMFSRLRDDARFHAVLRKINLG